MSGDVATGGPSVAILTPIGRGAVATIRVEADLEELDRTDVCFFHAVNGQSLSRQAIGKTVFGRWGRVQEQREDVVVCRVATKTLEVHCHGGDAAAQRIVDDLRRAGCEEVSWTQQIAMTRDELETDCFESLSRCSTWRTAEIVHEQLAGLLRRAFEEMLQLSTDDVDRDSLRIRLDELLAWARFGQHLSQPWNVVLTGRPNVGKSSLINALLGYQRSIVFDQPGTTRDVVTGETAFDGWPVLLADTAGLRETTEELEAAGIAMAHRRLEAADDRLIVLDLSEPPSADDERLLASWPDALIVANKCDLADRWEDRLPHSAIRVSSVTTEGLDELQKILVRRLVPDVPPVGTAIPLNDRQIDLLTAARSNLNASDRQSMRRALQRLFGPSNGD